MIKKINYNISKLTRLSFYCGLVGVKCILNVIVKLAATLCKVNCHYCTKSNKLVAIIKDRHETTTLGLMPRFCVPKTIKPSLVQQLPKDTQSTMISPDLVCCREA